MLFHLFKTEIRYNLWLFLSLLILVPASFIFYLYSVLRDKIDAAIFMVPILSFTIIFMVFVMSQAERRIRWEMSLPVKPVILAILRMLPVLLVTTMTTGYYYSTCAVFDPEWNIQISNLFIMFCLLLAVISIFFILCDIFVQFGINYLVFIIVDFTCALFVIGALTGLFFKKIITPYVSLGRISDLYHSWGIIVIPVIAVLVSAISIVTFVRRKTFLQ